MSDQVFSGIFTECVKAGPERCQLAAQNRTAEELEDAAYELLEIAKYQPFRVGTLVLDFPTIKAMYAQSLYTQLSWALVTYLVDSLMFGTEVPLAEILALQPSVNTTAASITSLLSSETALAGISCSDNQRRTAEFEDFAPAIEKLYSQSEIMGDLGVGAYMRCQQWQIEPKETYTGSFENLQSKSPPLFIGNTFDGHTPLKSAHNVSASFEDSVVLEIDGYGHGSPSVPSECTLKAISAYWVNGTLPEKGTRCERSVEPYTGDWWPQVFMAAGVNATWINGA